MSPTLKRQWDFFTATERQMNVRMKVAAVGAALMALALVGCSSNAAAGPELTPAAPEDGGQFSQELHDALPKSIRDKGYISFVGEANPPFRNVGSDGTVTGLQTDVLAEFEDILGIEIKTEVIDSLAGVKLGLQSGRNDAAFGPSLDTPATQESFDFVDVFVMRTGFLYPLSGPKVTDTTDVCGKKVAIQEGSPPIINALAAIDEQCNAAGREAVQQVPLADKNAAILAVQSGRAQLMATSPATMAFTIEQQPGVFGMYATTEEDFAGDLVGTSLAKGNDELRDVLYGAWKVLFENGKYEEILAKYGMESTALPEPVVNGATQ